MDNPKIGDVRWKRNAASFLVVYSILAAIATVILTTIIATDGSMALKEHWWATILPLGVAIFLFIYTAEKIVDAMDEDDVRKYVALFNFYNFAVILLIFGLIATIYFRYVFTDEICTFWEITNLAITALIFIVLTWRWWIHEWWLLSISNKEFQEYIDELEEKVTPEFDRQWGYCLFMWIRRKLAKKDQVAILPPVRFEIRRSPIDGVGLFSLRHFSAGEFIAEGIHKEDFRNLVKWADFAGLDESVKAKVLAFCVGTPVGFIPPPENDFNQLTPDWYMNHSCHGKVGFDGNGDFIARHPIGKGEELTFDYALAESNPNFVMDCTCGGSDCRTQITGDDWKGHAFQAHNRNFMLPHLRRL